MSSIKGRYARIEIPLDKVENDKELHVAGDYFSILSITGGGSCEIKLDHRHSRSIDLREISGITGLYERIYFTTDGGGGICTIFVGNGMAIQVLPDQEKLWRGEPTSAQVSTLALTVQPLATYQLRLRSVIIQNSNGIYACYIGPYNLDLATFKAHAYVLLPHKMLKFAVLEMYSMGCVSYDGSNNVTLNIIGTYG
jgi:hypothetical protein